MTPSSRKTLTLVDGSSYLFRAFHGLPELSNSKGQPTHAILGVLNMLKKLCAQHPCEHIAVVFDAKGKNFRHALYPDYKAHRAAMPEGLKVQIEPLHQIIQALGYPLVMVSGVEADDVIGTLAYQALARGIDVLISSGDKDLAQLIQPGVKIIDTMKNVMMDEAYVFEKFGVHAHQIIDFLALTGDSSDNIPGVPGVGAKTAAKWLAQYGTVDALKAHAHEILGKVGENLRGNFPLLDLSKQLVTLNCQVDFPLDWNALCMQPRDTAFLHAAFSDLELHSWLKEIKSNLSTYEKSAMPICEPEQVSQDAHYVCVNTPALWNLWREKLSQAKILSVDLETSSLDPFQARLIGISFAIQPFEALYIPLQHDTMLENIQQLPYAQTLQDLKVILENPDIAKVGQNLKFDAKVLSQLGIALSPLMFDTMLASYILESGQTRHDLQTLAQRHLKLAVGSYEDLTGKGAKQISFDQVPIEQATHYSAEDADLTLRLYHYFQAHLSPSSGLLALFQEVEMPMLSVLARMELTGVLIDAEVLKHQSLALAQKIQTLETTVHTLAGQPFNLGSPKQLQGILFEVLKLPILKKTPGGQPSTNEEVLEELAFDHELPQLLLEHRHLSKLKSTYTDRLPLEIEPKTGRIHTHYHQTGTITGRLSSSDPNLQNIPIKTQQGRAIRSAFIAPPGYQMVSADYSQIELRIMAHLSKDPALLKAFREGKDIHKATAAEVSGCPLDQVTGEMRRQAKAVNFGLIYGMSAFGLAKQLGISRTDAQAYVDLYFKRYPGVLNYMTQTREVAAQRGYVETLLGRRLYLPEIQSKNPMMRKGAERAAINAPMQGTAADIIKCAMIVIDREIQQQQLPVQMIMQVHDELVFEVKTEYVTAFIPQLKTWMTQALALEVPLEVSIGVGANWEEAH